MRRVLLAILTLMLLTLITGCVDDTPKVDIDKSTSSVIVQSGVPSEFITWDITRTDSKETGTTFTLVFDNKESVYAVNVDGNKIPQLVTSELKGKMSKDALQFKIVGVKSPDDDSAQKSLDLRLLWNGTTYRNGAKDGTITVKVQ